MTYVYECKDCKSTTVIVTDQVLDSEIDCPVCGLDADLK